MRRAYVAAGFFILFLVWGTELFSFEGHHFTSHMTGHMLVVAWAPLFISLGISGASYDPSRKYPDFFSPILSSVAELVVVWGWHAPVPHALARHSALHYCLEQGSFFLVGTWLWLSVLRNRESGIIGLLLTSMHMTFLGALLAMSPRGLYGSHADLSDLHLGGSIMIITGGFTYLAGGVWLTLKLLKERQLEKIA